MNKIEFFKNNSEVEVDIGEISYFKEELRIEKNNAEMLVILDFKEKTCKLKTHTEGLEINIAVISMEHTLLEEKAVFEYVLESEPKIKNRINIYEN